MEGVLPGVQAVPVLEVDEDSADAQAQVPIAPSAALWRGPGDPDLLRSGHHRLHGEAAARLRHLHLHGTHRNQQDVDLAIKVFSRGQAARVTSIVRSVTRDGDLTDRTRTNRLIELVHELGLSAPETRPKRFPIKPTDVHLIAWMAIVPLDNPPDWAGELFADETRLL